jgi:hypothetical protein
VIDAIRHFNEAFHYSLNPQAAYSPEEIQLLIAVARMRGRPDIADEISSASGEKIIFDDGSRRLGCDPEK